MSEHINATVHIGQLNLRIPGNSADAGHRVANGIAQSLAQRVTVGVPRHLGVLSVRVHAPASSTEGEMSHAIAEAIARVLRRGNLAINPRT
jgi:hypothetical protein